MSKARRLNTLGIAASHLAKAQKHLIEADEFKLARAVGEVELDIHQRAHRIERAPPPPKKKR